MFKKQVIIALIIVLGFSVVYVTSNPSYAEAYKVNQGYAAKI